MREWRDMVNSSVEFRAYHRRVSLIRTLYSHTADENYIGARSAFFDGRDYDFWWLTSHAVEKYLKATILLNSGAVGSTHNLIDLMKVVRDIDARLVPERFAKPEMSGVLDEFIGSADFVERLNIYGNAANRYGLYSYIIGDLDILRADHLVYWARRHARVLTQNAFVVGDIDWVGELANSPGIWMHHDGSPLEKLANGPFKSLAARSFVRGNVAFFPKRRHQPLPRRGALVRNGPFYNMLSALQSSEGGSDDRAEMRIVLEWALKNIVMPKEDRDHLREVLQSHP